MTKSGEIGQSLSGGGSVSGSGAIACAAARTEETRVLMLEHTYRVGDGQVTCRLYRRSHCAFLHRASLHRASPHPAVFELEMEGFSERRHAAVGENPSIARAIYDALVRNTVTPCALEDVLEDFRELYPPVGIGV